jgi:hypothetical protein
LVYIKLIFVLTLFLVRRLTMRTTSKLGTVFDAKPINGLVRAVCKCLLLLPVTGALAMPFDSNVHVQAEVSLAAPGLNSSQAAVSGADQTGQFSKVVGGVTSTANVDKTLAVTSGTLPLSGILTGINDGVGMNFTSNASFSGSSPSRSLSDL